MSTTLIQTSSLPPCYFTGPVGPQLSTPALTVLAGAEIDATQLSTVLSYTCVADTSVLWSVWGANQSNYADEVLVYTSAIPTTPQGGVGNYAEAPIRYRFYRVKIMDQAPGVHGNATVSGIAKA